MKTNAELNHLLRDADPVTHEPGLSPETLAEMRRAMVAAASGDRRAAPAPRFFAIATAAALLAVATVAIVRRPEPVRVPPLAPSAQAPADQPKRTQVYFSTPGGTRIIWTLDPTFQLKEVRR
jgi:hypothetical protein